jgi:two-component system, OmpR family, response regulator
MFQVLVVEDDKNTAKLMKAVLTHAGYEVYGASDGAQALDVTDIQHIDLIVLDVMMPVMDGYEFTKRLRSCGDNTPILMVTAKQLPEEKCKGFLVGTDDYMVKPVNEDEMLLRIKALLRRAQIANERKLRIGKAVLDYDALTVFREGVSQTLPQKEFYLLYKLLSYPDKIFTRLQLMDEIWGMESETVDTTVNVHINRLRKRFESWPEFKIVAIRGIGYKAVISSGYGTETI